MATTEAETTAEIIPLQLLMTIGGKTNQVHIAIKVIQEKYTPNKQPTLSLIIIIIQDVNYLKVSPPLLYIGHYNSF